MDEKLMEPGRKKEILKDLIRRLHNNVAQEDVKVELKHLLGSVPYEHVVQAEQELMAEGVPQEEIIALCDVHSSVLKGALEKPDMPVPPGHPIHTMLQENIAVGKLTSEVFELLQSISSLNNDDEARGLHEKLKVHMDAVSKVDKHYSRKANLLFPYLEKKGITGPSRVMWAKDNEVLALIKDANKNLASESSIDITSVKLMLPAVKKALDAVIEMFYKEEHILFPMCLEKFSADEWTDIERQSDEIGYTLYEPRKSAPGSAEDIKSAAYREGDRISLPSGSFSLKELVGVFNRLPVDITFVDAEDTVRFFSETPERIFTRSRAIIGRKVQMCHPPASVHIVEKILNDFKSGERNSAAFWIELSGRFIHIEYFALRDERGAYLGTLEVSQDLTEKKALSGEKRLLEY
jgi:hypothetical protein